MKFEFNESEVELIKDAVRFLGENTSYCERSEECDELLENINTQLIVSRDSK